MQNFLRLALDQGLSSLSLFIFSVALAREFGALNFSLFAMALSSSLIIIAILNAAYIEPNAINKKENPKTQSIIKPVFLLSLAAAALCLAITKPENALAIFIFIAGNSALYSSRRISTLAGEHKKLYTISIVSFLLISSATLILSKIDTIINHWLIIYGIIGITSVAATSRKTKPNKEDKTHSQPDFKNLAAAVMFWLCTNFYFYYLPATGHPEASGQLRMLLTLFMPALQFGTILGSLLITSKISAKKSIGLAAATTIAYGVALTLIGPGTLRSVTNIEIPLESLLFATIMAAAMNLSGIISISARIKNRAKILLLSSSVSAAALVAASPAAINLNNTTLIISACYALSIMLTVLIPSTEK